MSRNRPLPYSGKTHPLTGRPIQALGFRRDGRPIWPLIGAADPVRPDDVSEEEWEALGDPGKQALVRVRQERDDAVNAKAEADRQLAAARARPTAPAKPTDPPKPPAGGQPGQLGQPGQAGDQPDFAAMINAAVAKAFEPIQAAQQQRDAQDAADKIKQAVMVSAKDRLHDATDGLMIDLASVVAADGTPDTEKIGKALDALVAAKPHLAKDTRRFAAPGVGPTVGGAQVPMADQVKNVLAQMQSATGVRLPSSE